LLDALITPVLFLMFGRKPLMRLMQRQSEERVGDHTASHSY
jgi:HME family heavy-metal exporter